MPARHRRDSVGRGADVAARRQFAAIHDGLRTLGQMINFKALGDARSNISYGCADAHPIIRWPPSQSCSRAARQMGEHLLTLWAAFLRVLFGVRHLHRRWISASYARPPGVIPAVFRAQYGACRVVGGGRRDRGASAGGASGEDVTMFGYDDYEQIWPNTVHWAKSSSARRTGDLRNLRRSVLLLRARPTVDWELMTTDDFQLLRAYAATPEFVVRRDVRGRRCLTGGFVRSFRKVDGAFEV